jgi:hypothetical protein
VPERGDERSGTESPGKSRKPSQARGLIGWLALRSRSATLTQVAAHLHREISTLSHAVSSLEKRSRNLASFANILNQHLFSICQA